MEKHIPRRLLALFALLVMILSLSCDDEKSSEPPIPPGCKRAGSVCNDGRTTTSTDPDACDGAGGFKEWLCQK